MGVVLFIMTVICASICIECQCRIEIAERCKHLRHAVQVDREIKRYNLIAKACGYMAVGFGATFTAYLLLILENSLQI